ncbi:MAG: 3-isopropylmalate dehydrogenase, partial [Ktedonobacterales bacterium]|nr:3-isopropylmalate dehydrogenase [Ktedonobacterales bacterium]
FGLYEPIHGTAPDITGQGKANPLAAILSVALLLRHSLGLKREAAAVERAVRQTVAAGLRTADIAGPRGRVVSTHEMGAEVVRRVRHEVSPSSRVARDPARADG